MSVYIVTWNLNQEGAEYQKARTAFLNQLGNYDNTKDSQLDTVRWISTTSTAQQVSDFLQQKLDKNDRLYISKVVTGTYAGWLEKSVSDWINARL